MIESANAGQEGTIKKSYTMTEMSITGNMKMSDMQDRKIKWKTVDDEKTEFAQSKIDYTVKNYDTVELGPQMIRTFKVEFGKKAFSTKNLDAFM